MMRKSLKTRIMENSFWLSMLLHLLILLAILLIIKFRPEPAPPQQQQSHQYVPSYVYTGAVAPPTINKHKQRTQTVKNTQKFANPVETVDNKPAAKIEATPNVTKPQPNAIAVGKKKRSRPTSMLAASTEMLQQEQMRSLTNRPDEEPILMIGDTTRVADPFIKLLAKSLSAHFRYPDNEGMMGIKGRVLVVLTIHPEGYYTDVELVKTSENQNLDAAALYAVNTAPRVIGASTFIQKPKRFLIGYIFE